MTHINLVEPAHLTNKHLVAEYCDIPHIFAAVAKLHGQGETPSCVEIPPQYDLDKGHCRFFYNKLHWLLARFQTILDELLKRGYHMDVQQANAIVTAAQELPVYWFGVYKPEPEDIYLSMARICKRSGIAAVSAELESED